MTRRAASGTIGRGGAVDPRRRGRGGAALRILVAVDSTEHTNARIVPVKEKE